MPQTKFKLICNGLFHSKLTYCLQVFSHVWDIPSYDEVNRRFSTFTRGDNRKLQVLQNKVMRLKSGLHSEHQLWNLQSPPVIFQCSSSQHILPWPQQTKQCSHSSLNTWPTSSSWEQTMKTKLFQTVLKIQWESKQILPLEEVVSSSEVLLCSISFP